MAQLTVEVVYALPERQQVVRLALEDGATALDAVEAAGIGAAFAALARFGQKIDPGTRLRDGDRIELLRPLVTDPQEARRARARRRAAGR